MSVSTKFLVSFVFLGSQLLLGCTTGNTSRTDRIAPKDERAKVIANAEFRERVNECRTQLLLDEIKRQKIVDGLEFISPVGISCFWPFPTAPGEIDPHRSLIVHDRATLDAADFSLQHTLDQIALQVSSRVPGTTAVGIFKQLWDTQNPAPGFTSGPHCDDNGQTVNGYPVSCRPEGAQAGGGDAAILNTISGYSALALVNRLDLAHQGWRNCGEHRIIYGTTNGPHGENLLIFEAVLPNPRPGCPCVEVAEYWKSLSAIDDPSVRAAKLAQLFYTGIPGFRPVIHVDHYSVRGASSVYGGSGSGQIRTNQFFAGPWTLKEFRTVLDCGAGGSSCTFQLVPIAVKVNPYGFLWNEDIANDPGHPLQATAANFQASVTSQLASLSSGSLMGITYSVQLAHDSAQSSSGSPPDPQHTVDNYRDQFNAATVSAPVFRGSLTSATLSAEQIVNRALTQSCAGCHHPGNFDLRRANSIGAVTTPTGTIIDKWPDAIFRHVRPTLSAPSELAVPTVFGSGQGYDISDALKEAFLPARTQFLLDTLNGRRCLCLHRFQPLKNSAHMRAVEIQQRLAKRFEPRFGALNKSMNEAADQPAVYRALERKGVEMQREFDTQLHAELRRVGIKLSDVDLEDTQPQVMRLQAAKRAGGDKKREQALRVSEINDILKQEPPRRTVTGSFAAH